MAVPKRRTSKRKKRARRTHYKAAPVALQPCPRCGDQKRPHRVCPTCGDYDREQRVEGGDRGGGGGGETPLAAIRSKPNSSIAVGFGLQKKDHSEAFISAGNTGAV